MLIRPGQKTAIMTLQAVLRERHESIAADVARDIERRKRDGVVFDEGIEWPAVQAAVDARDAIKVRTLVEGARRPLPPYEDVPGYDVVRVRFVALSAARRADLVKVVVDAYAADQAADAEVGILEYLRATVAELVVDGESLSLASDDDVVAVKATRGLFFDLYVAARDYQGLPAGKEKRFGSPPPSTT